ncbi:hypothetical protein PFLUV_G00142060 [Perca fluviatilis]|uniref:Integrase catalytic domain-containing protein n=1 Tax=Perca fluviatilis TaxID=8168 RepID=A0A6A5ESX3_PERFL|nr:hypothetical protein PFLUV_G00142060 [Perca fluviatilis]
MCSRFYWYGMTVDIDKWISECDQCQRVGPPLNAVKTLDCIKVSAVWELIGIDLTGPLQKTSTGHGCPKRILSDQGREFVNQINSTLCELLSIERSVTAAYHPQTNGLDEKTNDNIKRALKKLVNDQQDDWDQYLDAIQKLWSSKDTGQVEAVVGPYKIYDTSFRTLSGHGWLSDEIIDAYLHCIMKLAKIPVHCLDAVLGSSVFHRGQFRVVQKMKLPTASTWICPVNVGGHWILVIVKMDEKSLLVIDPLGNENMYQRKILWNWRNFWKTRNVSEGPWTIQTAKHNLQQDGSSCGVLILMFAELILQGRSICVAQTDTEEVLAARVKIAATLLECKDGVEDLCVSCNMLQFDAEEDFTEMVIRQ